MGGGVWNRQCGYGLAWDWRSHAWRVRRAAAVGRQVVRTRQSRPTLR